LFFGGHRWTGWGYRSCGGIRRITGHVGR
jgi:hypothetical protein